MYINKTILANDPMLRSVLHVGHLWPTAIICACGFERPAQALECAKKSIESENDPETRDTEALIKKPTTLLLCSAPGDNIMRHASYSDLPFSLDHLQAMCGAVREALRGCVHVTT